MNIEEQDINNDYKIIFTNGIYDLIANKFIEGTSKLNISIGYKYEEADEDSINFINEILISIIPDDNDRKYLLTSLSLGLIGDNPLGEVYFWYGSGGNGRGLIKTLVMNTMGRYFGILPLYYINSTSKKILDPPLASVSKCRIIIVNGTNKKIKSARLKKLIGKEEIEVRTLYEKPYKFIPKFKLIIENDRLSKIDNLDEDLIEKIRVIKFPYNFVDNPTKPNEKRSDNTLKSKIEENKYMNAFFQILVNHYSDYVKNGNILEMSDNIIQATEEYINSM